jgi:molybdopterin converting factor small subunit
VSVSVRLHAGVRERAKTATLVVEGASIAAVRDALAAKCPAIAGQLRSCRFAVDDEFVDESTPVAPGSTVDVIPPVSGG